MIDNKLLGITVLGLGSLVAYKIIRSRGVEEEVAIMSEPLPPLPPEDVATEYEQATIDWSARFVGELLPNGDKIFEPLDISEGNPLRLYYAIVKKKPAQGTWGHALITKDKQYMMNESVGEIWLYNTLTKREVRLDELSKQKSMTVDAKKATEETFANAFVDSCKINPAYDAWNNRILVIPTRHQFEYQKGECDMKYSITM